MKFRKMRFSGKTYPADGSVWVLTLFSSSGHLNRPISEQNATQIIVIHA